MSEVMFVGYWPSLHTDRQEYRDFMRLRQTSIGVLKSDG